MADILQEYTFFNDFYNLWKGDDRHPNVLNDDDFMRVTRESRLLGTFFRRLLDTLAADPSRPNLLSFKQFVEVLDKGRKDQTFYKAEEFDRLYKLIPYEFFEERLLNEGLYEYSEKERSQRISGWREILKTKPFKAFDFSFDSSILKEKDILAASKYSIEQLLFLRDLLPSENRLKKLLTLALGKASFTIEDSLEKAIKLYIKGNLGAVELLRRLKSFGADQKMRGRVKEKLREFPKAINSLMAQMAQSAVFSAYHGEESQQNFLKLVEDLDLREFWDNAYLLDCEIPELPAASNRSENQNRVVKFLGLLGAPEKELETYTTLLEDFDIAKIIDFLKTTDANKASRNRGFTEFWLHLTHKFENLYKTKGPGVLAGLKQILGEVDAATQMAILYDLLTLSLEEEKDLKQNLKKYEPLIDFVLKELPLQGENFLGFNSPSRGLTKLISFFPEKFVTLAKKLGGIPSQTFKSLIEGLSAKDLQNLTELGFNFNNTIRNVETLTPQELQALKKLEGKKEIRYQQLPRAVQRLIPKQKTYTWEEISRDEKVSIILKQTEKFKNLHSDKGITVKPFDYSSFNEDRTSKKPKYFAEGKVKGQNHGRIYIKTELLPESLTSIFDLHEHKIVGFLGWVAWFEHEILPGEKVFQVWEIQSDLLQGTQQLSENYYKKEEGKPLLLKDREGKLRINEDNLKSGFRPSRILTLFRVLKENNISRSKVENLFRDWPYIFMNEAFKKAKDLGYRWVGLEKLKKGREDLAPIYNRIADAYPHKMVKVETKNPQSGSRIYLFDLNKLGPDKIASKLFRVASRIAGIRQAWEVSKEIFIDFLKSEKIIQDETKEVLIGLIKNLPEKFSGFDHLPLKEKASLIKKFLHGGLRFPSPINIVNPVLKDFFKKLQQFFWDNIDLDLYYERGWVKGEEDLLGSGAYGVATGLEYERGRPTGLVKKQEYLAKGEEPTITFLQELAKQETSFFKNLPIVQVLDFKVRETKNEKDRDKNEAYEATIIVPRVSKPEEYAEFLSKKGPRYVLYPRSHNAHELTLEKHGTDSIEYAYRFLVPDFLVFKFPFGIWKLRDVRPANFGFEIRSGTEEDPDIFKQFDLDQAEKLK